MWAKQKALSFKGGQGMHTIKTPRKALEHAPKELKCGAPLLDLSHAKNIKKFSQTTNARTRANQTKLAHAFFVSRITWPLTFDQSISASIFSSTSPQTTTLSPRIRYRPCSTCAEGSSSSGVRMMRSTVLVRTMLVSWSVERSVPRSVRPSTVRMRTFSVVRGTK